MTNTFRSFFEYFMKFFFILSMTLLIACQSRVSNHNDLTDIEIERLIIGSWYISNHDNSLYTANAVSTYTRDHNVYFTAFSDKNCIDPVIKTMATWKIENRTLIITVIKSTAPAVHPIGLRATDYIVSIDSNNKVLKSVSDGALQYRTSNSTCMVQSVL